MNTADQVRICTRLLELYGIANRVNAIDIKSLRAYKSQLYGFMNVYSFDYKNNHYYVTDDYSLMDNPKYVEDVLKDIVPTLTGKPLKNPTSQSDGAVYASGLFGTEYYLWKALLK